MRPWLTPRLEVSRVEIVVPDLPEQLDGVCLAQVSDLHVGQAPWEPMRLEEAASVLRDSKPDLVLNTGDYFQGEPGMARVLIRVQTLRTREHPQVEGPANLTVLGNHDYYAGADKVRELCNALTSIGVKVLINEVLCLPIRGTEMTVAGLDAQQPGLDEAIGALRNAKKPRIILIHAPDLAQRLPAGTAELILAGHTHGGQIRIPFLSGPIVRRFSGSEYSRRRYEVNGIPLYINRGLGCTGVPLRFRARPELTLLRLRAPAKLEH